MKACDICLKEVPKLVELKDEFRTDRGVEICKDCETDLNKAFSKITDALIIQRNNWFRNFIKNFKR